MFSIVILKQSTSSCISTMLFTSIGEHLRGLSSSNKVLQNAHNIAGPSFLLLQCPANRLIRLWSSRQPDDRLTTLHSAMEMGTAEIRAGFHYCLHASNSDFAVCLSIHVSVTARAIKATSNEYCSMIFFSI